MDLWGTGCVFFEVLSLVPLFPGNNELDQVHKIHNIMGTPEKELLDRFQQHASHMTFNFPEKSGTGIADLIPHISKDAQDLIMKLLIYNPDKRITATQALKHAYFNDLRQAEQKQNFNVTQPVMYSGGPSDRDEDKNSGIDASSGQGSNS